MLELTAEEEKELRAKYGDDYLAALDEEENGDHQSNDGSEAENQVDEEEVEEDDNISSDDEEHDEVIENAGDSDNEDGEPSKAHFGDEQSQKIAEKVSKVEAKAWSQKIVEDAVLKTVTSFSVSDKPLASLAAPADRNTLQDFNVKHRIQNQWLKINEECLQDHESIMTPLQKSLFHAFNQYQDVAYCNRDIDNAKEIRRAYALHALNHVMKNRDRIMKNNERISKAQKANRDIEEIRDQGFTRPKVLIILPFRNAAVDVVNSLIELSGSEQQEHKKRFFDEFNLMEEEEEKSDKPLDYQETFKGNIDDHFRLGIKFTRKTMKLYSDFYSADIIIASPLGLRTVIGAEGDKKRDFDFLSSLEVIIMDQTQQFLMQNWDHIEVNYTEK